MAILDELLDKTQTEAIEKAKETTLGKTKDADGNVVLGPDTAKILDYLNEFKQQLDTANDTISEQASLLLQQGQLITQLTSLLNGKASADSLATVRQNVTTLLSTVAGKADTAYVEQQFAANYELDTRQTNAINAAQELLATDGGLLTNLMAAQTQLGNLVTGLRADVDLKAPAATVSTLTGQVTTLRNTLNDGTTGLAATNTLAATANAEAAKRLLKTGDVATGSIMVPMATTGPAAPRFDQTYGGLNSPVRAAYGFGSTPVALGPGPLTDPTPQGRKAQVIQVFLTMKTAPTLGLNVTIKVGTTPGGSEVFSKNYLLTALPGLNGLLAGVPTSIAELPAGTILYATAVNATLANSPGSWDVIVQSYYKS